MFASAPGTLGAPTLAVWEAPIDALSLAEAGLPTIALCGVNPGICWPDWLPKRPRFRTVYFAFDTDAGGEDAADAADFGGDDGGYGVSPVGAGVGGASDED